MLAMERFRVVGGARLEGEVQVTGAKNSVLKVMAAALLAQGRTTLTHVPRILDVEIMGELLRRLGCEVDYDAAAATVAIDVPDVLGHQADYDLVRRIRASICVLGPLTARCGQAEVAMPGGDAIGSRPLDFHLAGLAKLGAELDNEHGYIVARAPHGLTGATVWLDFPSVGATENILMAAVLASGTTVIDNAAREPEIVDLCRMLQQMGAKIDGLGSSTLTVEGVDHLSPTTHSIVPDRIVAGTWAFASAMTQGDITVHGARAEHLEIALDKLVGAGATVHVTEDGFRVVMTGRPTSVDAVTLPYPGLATDLQPLASWPASGRTCAPTATTRWSGGCPGCPAHPCGPATSAPVPLSRWPAWWPTESPTSATSLTWTGATRASTPSCASWGQTSPASLIPTPSSQGAGGQRPRRARAPSAAARRSW